MQDGLSILPLVLVPALLATMRTVIAAIVGVPIQVLALLAFR